MWLVFALPPAELAAHPASSQGGDVDLYLMCDDIEATMDELWAAAGVCRVENVMRPYLESLA